MKKWIIGTIILAILLAGTLFLSGTITGKAIATDLEPNTIEKISADHTCDGNCTGNHEPQIKESCDNLDCPKRDTELCKHGF
jgi:hypothetical protein